LIHRRRIPAALLALALAVAVVAMGACGATPQTTLEPTTEAARTARDLLMFVFWAMVVTFVLVEGALLYCLIRFRRRSGDGIPAQTHGNTPLEIGWTIAPAVLVVIIVVLTVPAIFSNARAAGPDALKVRAIGHQWWFEFQYPDLGVTTANELHLPVGREVEIQLGSNDVLHSFWVPSLRGKLDMVPGRENKFTIKPEVTGTFPGQCAEFCGRDHARMIYTVRALPEGEYNSWFEEKAGEAPAPIEGDFGGEEEVEQEEGAVGNAANGQSLFFEMGCNVCHGDRGEGLVGPTIAMTVVPLDRVITQYREPLEAMTAFPPDQVSDEEIADIYAWLQTVPRPPDADVIPSKLAALIEAGG